MPTPFLKDKDANKPYAVDWSAFLGSDTIITSTWIVPSGINVTQTSIDSSRQKTILWVGGGSLDAKYEITNRVTTAQGLTEDWTLVFQICDQ